ncbi:extracellular solute-binding protein [Streptosporangium carneum]|uniref:Spermidine/putrescine ABC transporter substrate-binding protein n=1 Tax=Streptosporangium carneum TaxID=47481 RepID=A0A9W6MH51_9ACTN|nr:extracellular solute-binding protein [Streptosporangium carneum]GLK14484.1 spermidine/putrescine ABC transporter substrate-binding protein [Streptosporangium carneum]
MGRYRFRRAHLGTLAGALTLAVCARVGVEAAVERAPASPASRPSAPSPSSPSSSPTGSPGSSPDGSGPSPAPSASIGKAEGTLQVLTFQGHVEYGGATSSADWVSPFEKLTGCRISRLDRVRTSEEMADKLRGASYDVVSPSPDLAGRLVAEGEVVPLDTGLLQFYKDIPRRLRESPATRGGDGEGRVYGVPFLWGVNQVMYEGAEPEGPDALYRTERAAIRNTPLGIADAALALRETQPALGIKDPFQLTAAQLDAAEKLLAEKNGPQRIYWQSSLDVIQAFATGEVRLAQALPYHLDLFRRAGRPVKEMKAKAMTGWVDSWMVGADAPSPNCAYKWLNWVSSADTQRAAAAWTGLAPANQKACDGDARRLCEIYHVRDDRWLRRVLFAVRPTKDCGGLGGECTDYPEWEKGWKSLVK